MSEETLSVPPGCRCVFGAEWAGGFDPDGCAAHGPTFATLTAQVATLEGEREELCKMVERCVGDVSKGSGGLYGLGCQAINSHRRGAHDVGSVSVESARKIETDARALVRRVRGGT